MFDGDVQEDVDGHAARDHGVKSTLKHSYWDNIT